MGQNIKTKYDLDSNGWETKQGIRTSARSPWKAIVAVVIAGLLIKVGEWQKNDELWVLSDCHPAIFCIIPP